MIRFYHRTARSFVAVLVMAIPIGFSLHTQGGGFLETEESYYFVQSYLADRGLLEKVFDIEQNDWGAYQARELSYLVDFFDVRFIMASIRAGIPHFYPLSHYLSLLAIGLLLVNGARRHLPALPFPHTLLLALLFLTSPLSFYTTYFRSAKILTGLLTTTLVWFAWTAFDSRCGPSSETPPDRAAPRDPRLRASAGFGLFFLALALTLVDRQGFYLAGLLGGLSVTMGLLTRSRAFLAGGMVVLAALAVSVFYNFVLGPQLILWTNGYRPAFNFQDLQFITNRFRDPAHYPPDAASLRLFPETVGFFFGNSGVWGGTLVLCGVAGTLALRMPGETSADARRMAPARLIAFFVGVLAMLVLNWIMVLKAPYLLWIEKRVTYYGIPATALVLLTAAFALNRLLFVWPRLRKPVLLALLACLAGNVAALPAHQRSWLHPRSGWSGYASAPELFECLRGRGGGAGLTERERAFCRAIRRRIDPTAAAPAGSAAAIYDLATRFMMGDGVPKKPKRAIRLYRKAAKAGDQVAQVELARRYYEGNRVPKSPEEVARWLRLAAKGGHPLSQFQLSEMYRTGFGVPESEAESVAWLQRAAEGDVPEAQFALGLRFRDGEGVPRSLVLAHMWLTLSLDDRRPPGTRQLIGELEDRMDAMSVADAQHRAREWRDVRRGG